MKVKKIIGLMLVAVLALMLFACGQKKEGSVEGTTEGTVTEMTAADNTAEVTETSEETTTEPKTTIIETMTEETTEETTEEETEDPDHPEGEGWNVKDGLAIRIDGYTFNTEYPQLMVEGQIEVIKEDKTISPADVLSIHVYQDGTELGYISGADLSEPLTSDSYMRLEDIYETINNSDDIEIEVQYVDGTTETWS